MNAASIDSAVSLAFSLHANKGAYALLVGSGVSRSAGIPTGWEVTLDLVRQLAATAGEAGVSDPEAWFRETYRQEPDYSNLLDQLFKVQAERQQCLKRYFEPDADEREQGLKAPTPAHHAIADLVALGYVRVIVTTNFDRLIEQALETRGVVPVIVANADQVAGMLPLVHQTCCVIKVHGDYLDTRIKNTVPELETYSPAMDRLLDRVFDEFGLILCGWSGAWDPALRSAITRAPSRRFASYWATLAPLSGTAETLARDRMITPVPTTGADRFFTDLADRLASLQTLDRPHPLSVQAAVATLKRYIAEDRHRIRLHDLVIDAVDDARVRWSKSGVSLADPQPTNASIPERMKAYDASLETLIALGLELGRWGRPEHARLVAEMLERLSRREPVRGSTYNLWSALWPYPATAVFYAVGLGALEADNFELLGAVAAARLTTERGEKAGTVERLAPAVLVSDKSNLRALFNSDRYTPLNDWLSQLFRPLVAPHAIENDYYDSFAPLFDRLEILFAVAYRAFDKGDRGWAPPGCWAWRHENQQKIQEQLKGELGALGQQAPLMRTGWFSSTEQAQKVLEEVYAFAGRLNFH
ncbi:hypothetical protein FJQ54_12475 [Sandaracinobacter neustonicus]|uniref:Uncharacterized protein n=1 Tax=Sandaracinobacter neustonicus TaxID=1715348 RepID=A0A501XHH5_9SPHN|nr:MULTISPECIES: SIR2 family protein [Alphaproteobacteria]TPE59747.1 hypothetical protein FJQ54_12475 [Sandaracinobacter neustonicus]